MTAWTTYPSPLGPLTLIGGTTGLRHVYFPGRAPSVTPSDRNPSTLAETVAQLDEYFAGERHAFEHQLGAQKVAWAIAATPTPIVVPCHRVIAADGSLTGYLGGLQRKRALLDFEAAGFAPDALHHRDAQQLALL
jgi:methylated-DNA-[protein]-cysteine S-methyltransferase